MIWGLFIMTATIQLRCHNAWHGTERRVSEGICRFHPGALDRWNQDASAVSISLGTGGSVGSLLLPPRTPDCPFIPPSFNCSVSTWILFCIWQNNQTTFVSYTTRNLREKKTTVRPSLQEGIAYISSTRAGRVCFIYLKDFYAIWLLFKSRQ